MYWEEENKVKQKYQIPDDVQDIVFSIRCKMLPLDHADALSAAIITELPWLQQEPLAGLHLIHVAESGNGWFRPEDAENEVLNLSRRTKLKLRLPQHRLADATNLIGKTLTIDGNELVVGTSTIKTLIKSPIVFSRYVLMQNNDEQKFLESVHAQLTGLGINVHKMMCGKQHSHTMPQGKIQTRSLMIADLEVEESIVLQQQGIGDGRLHGCGLFLAHKGIKAVYDPAEQNSAK